MRFGILLALLLSPSSWAATQRPCSTFLEVMEFHRLQGAVLATGSMESDRVEGTVNALTRLADLNLDSIGSIEVLRPVLNWAKKLPQGQRDQLIRGLVHAVAEAHPQARLGGLSGRIPTRPAPEPYYRRAMLLRELADPRTLLQNADHFFSQNVGAGTLVWVATEADIHRPMNATLQLGFFEATGLVLNGSRNAEEFLHRSREIATFPFQGDERTETLSGILESLPYFLRHLSARSPDIEKLAEAIGAPDLDSVLSYIQKIAEATSSGEFIERSNQFFHDSEWMTPQLRRAVIYSQRATFLRLWNGAPIEHLVQFSGIILPGVFSSLPFLQEAYPRVTSIEDLGEWISSLDKNWQPGFFHFVFLEDRDSYLRLTTSPAERGQAERVLPKPYFLMGERHRHLKNAETSYEFLNVLRDHPIDSSSVLQSLPSLTRQDVERFLALRPSLRQFREMMILSAGLQYWPMAANLVHSTEDFLLFVEPLFHVVKDRNEAIWQIEFFVRALNAFVTQNPRASVITHDADIDQLMEQSGIAEQYRHQVPSLRESPVR